MIERLQYITQDHPSKSHLDLIQEACEAGIKWVQLRMKGVSENELLKNAMAARSICDRFNCKLIINDSVAVAKESKADGVHLGKTDMNPVKAREIVGDLIIGGTANTQKDIDKLEKAGVDYIGLGPFRYTSTKKNLSPILGLDGYQKLSSSLPIIAIGGIEQNDISQLMETGIHGIAISGLLTNTANMHTVVAEVKKEMNQSVLI